MLGGRSGGGGLVAAQIGEPAPVGAARLQLQIPLLTVEIQPVGARPAHLGRGAEQHGQRPVGHGDEPPGLADQGLHLGGRRLAGRDLGGATVVAERDGRPSRRADLVGHLGQLLERTAQLAGEAVGQGALLLVGGPLVGEQRDPRPRALAPRRCPPWWETLTTARPDTSTPSITPCSTYQATMPVQLSSSGSWSNQQGHMTWQSHASRNWPRSSYAIGRSREAVRRNSTL